MIPSDEAGRLIPSELEREILKHKGLGHIPFFVSATAGTTVLGAFDPLPEIADICDKYGLWLHVDVSLNLFQLFAYSWCQRSDTSNSNFQSRTHAKWHFNLLT